MKSTRILLAILAIASAMGTEPSRATVLGPQPIINRTNVDTTDREIIVYREPWHTSGTVQSWSFYSNSGTVGNYITPLIFSHNGGGLFTITGIGLARQNDNSGLQQFTFDLQSGSDAFLPGVNDGAGTQCFIGFYNGQAGVAGEAVNPGFVEYDSTAQFTLGDGNDAYRYYSRFNNPHSASAIINGATFQAIQDFSTGTGFPRIYSFNFTSSVPEPSVVLLLGVGGLLAWSKRPRRS